VPTLNPGLSETVAAKLLTVASGRLDSTEMGLAGGCAGAAATDFMLARIARAFALDNAGSSSAASTAMMATTTKSSMRVKAGRERIFIRDLVSCFLSEQ
jgi:hypothetical protein